MCRWYNYTSALHLKIVPLPEKCFSEHFSEACFHIFIISSCIENDVVGKYERDDN